MEEVSGVCASVSTVCVWCVSVSVPQCEQKLNE